jgi:hypothetical protein
MSLKQSVISDRTGGRMAIEAGRNLAEWLYDWKWKWWVTLTFSNNICKASATALLDEYLNEVESTYGDSLTCVIAQEQKTYSGCGKPAGRVHFHLLVGCSIDLGWRPLQELWQLPQYGGDRTTGAGADVRKYDPQRGAFTYLAKVHQDRAADLTFRNLELLSPVPPLSADTSSKMRRKLLRSNERRLTGRAPLLELNVTSQNS